MKTLVVLFFGMLLWTQSAFASRASLSFFSRNGEVFQVIINGRLINKYPSDRVRLNDIPAGHHSTEIRFPDRYGVLVHRARFFLEPGYEAEYRIQLVGRRRRVDVQKVRMIPINSGIVPPYAGNPRPYPRQPDYRDRDRDREDRDDRRDDYYNPEDRYRRDDRYSDRNQEYECRDVLQGSEFERFYRAVADRSFDDNKMALAKQVLGQSTIYAEDLKRVMKLFSFENNKIELAKYMHNQVCDRRNFYLVYDAFSFESSVREMDRFLNNQ